MSAPTGSPPSVRPIFDLRSVLFLVILVLSWVSLTPFQNLGAIGNFELSSGNDILLYVAFGLLAAAAAVVVWLTDRPALRSILVPNYVVLVAWVAVTCCLSQDLLTSLKRVALSGFACICSMSLFLLPRDREEMARLFSIFAILILILSYFGVVFLPQFAIHQATDLGEPQLAGDWRGVFDHKNLASAMFSILAFVGIFLLRTGCREGWAITVLSLIFVVASGGKSSTVLCLCTIVFSVLALRLRNPVLWSIVVFAPAIILNAIGVGTVLWQPLAALSDVLPVDQTFTGRTDIWAFAVRQAADRLIFGHGIGAFWNTEVLRYGSEQNTIWAGNARHAHNGYLDAVLSMGLPGLVVAIARFRDTASAGHSPLRRARRRAGRDAPVAADLDVQPIHQRARDLLFRTRQCRMDHVSLCSFRHAIRCQLQAGAPSLTPPRAKTRGCSLLTQRLMMTRSN